MGGLSAQALGLLFLLTPACLFFLSFTYSQGAVKPEFQRGVLMDSALFVLASSLLHAVVGGTFLAFLEATTACKVLQSLAGLASTPNPLPMSERCSIELGFGAGLVYLLLVSIAALLLGWVAAKIVSRTPKLYKALYGPFHDPSQVGSATIVTASVLTDIEKDGKLLMYEGVLDEISLSASRSINYVCLLSPQRLYLTLDDSGAKTSQRESFVKIDGARSTMSRLVIPGDNIKNLLTRTRTLSGVPPELANQDGLTRRSLIDLKSLLWWKRDG